MKIAMIGLGHMGLPMARRLLVADGALVVYNRTRAKADALGSAGASVADTPADAARDADVVVTSLLDDASMLAILEGEDGLLAGMRPEAIHVSTATISPGCAAEVARRHAAAGHRYVAAPVVGRPPSAEAGTLLVLAAGTTDAVEDAGPALERFASRILHVGPDAAMAYTMKLAINFFVIASVEVFGEATALTTKAGIEPEVTRSLMQEMLRHPALDAYLERVRDARFDDAGFEATAGLKDVNLMLGLASDLRAPLPVAGIVRDRLLTALAAGHEASDWSVIAGVAREAAGLPAS